MKYADVALSIPQGRCFTYLIPGHLTVDGAGIRVRVPLGKREAIGYVVHLKETCDFPVKPILEVIDIKPVISRELLELTEWVSKYYRCGWGEAIRAALPPGMDAKQLRMVWLNGNYSGQIPAEPMLDHIIEKGSVSHQYLLKKFAPSAEKGIEEYCRMGLLFSEPVWQKARIAVRKERWLSGRSPADKTSLKLSKGQAELLDLVEQKGAVPPSAIKSKRPAALRLVALGLAGWEWREKFRGQEEQGWAEEDAEVTLNAEQQQVLDSVSRDINSRMFSVNLISGVTSSGKTEIYLKTAERALAQGRQVLILVPEIGMTSQMLHRVRSRLGQVAVWHSEMGSGERYDAWRAVRRGDFRVVVGTRSAVFTPFDDLGLIVVDEEHDACYKQSDLAPLYHARDLAIIRARKSGAVVLMGSATPSVESYYKARMGKFKLFRLEKRVGSADLPMVEVVDLKKLPREDRLISPLLGREIGACLQAGRQAMILLNRRGFAPYLQCGKCGSLITCPNCSVSLTYHRSGESVLCHYCGYQARLPEACPACGSLMLEHRGYAIQRLEAELKNVFPKGRISRMDADTTGRKGEHHRILQDFLSGGSQILLGTQMISKGHHFPNVSLVGIINLDDILGLPDFRAAERAFQLMVQMAGRAGRGRHPGKVVIQTRMPDNPVVKWCRENDYYSFAEHELAGREECGYPPHRHLALLTFTSGSQADLEDFADSVAEKIKSGAGRAEVLGPAPAPLAKIKGRFRWQLMLKAGSPSEIKKALEGIASGRNEKIRLSVDIDPVNML
ncbi:MAG: primosomal protein N' [Candidatus Edwardsbacteria bacterium RIFOXYD12_FULL_50_11]|uniref:Replication restart protein PriA n=1 Tax=Candidatus Edwardsbacteria bacterium GWF2_54_11 TaxID=1817851 RepID=A0A1F5REA0_9BACT|nr:MAG: primosomal protein N' [Candidatus Edwardsbacteria bacterium RifOxyC12_full_54_24]OGF08232.1 MAG: primosomal protein N' [Candidatus Edwardsbacteria bacterium RifOxyA12_full_54_48]OGF11529.1 MAG: primosomal protein N' [Candidatus Edwardsbacteria bacterium GWE2_54_12]OGF12734.1 MAG: primosomal protein N' [Candidatus Edwardsbacteria bacterium GWF2_54_11]OGF14831.1 MAG: primosomal protein N' [Candidatus Edwardsbacteria bacterium RIFOXYD12_FULL_50_11]OGJ17225.1 MAG: primosomal protein N' [Ca